MSLFRFRVRFLLPAPWKRFVAYLLCVNIFCKTKKFLLLHCECSLTYLLSEVVLYSHFDFILLFHNRHQQSHGQF